MVDRIMRGNLLFFCSVLLLCAELGACARILIVPILMKSHVFECLSLVDELHAHERYVVLSSASKESYKNLINAYNVKVLTFKSSNPVDNLGNNEFAKAVMSIGLSPDRDKQLPGVMRNHIKPALDDNCKDILNDLSFVDLIKSMNFDLAVVDAFPFSHCQYILPHSLGIPFVSVTTPFDAWTWRIPALPSFVPIKSKPYTDIMTFSERLDNLMNQIKMEIISMIQKDNRSHIENYLSMTNRKSIIGKDIVKESELLFVNQDHILDYPLPVMPHVITVGGLTTKPAKPLPEDLEEFIGSATHGIILFSFGSLGNFLPLHVSNKVLLACGKINQKVIMLNRNSEITNVPENVKIVRWLPQNDILGHSKTKLFITHSGNNGQYEALYHGVPMLAFHLFADQEFNARRIQHKGFGLEIDIRTFTTDQLVRNINHMVTNESFRETIGKASQIFRDMPQSPQQKAAYWIEHVIKYGSSHLKSHSLRMPLYEYLMLDILIFLIGLVLVIVTLITFCIYVLIKIFRNKKTKQE